MQGFAADGCIVNLSASGALVASELPASLNMRVLLQLPSQPDQGTGPMVRAEVIRVVEDGFAVEWDEFSPPPVRALLRQLGTERSAFIDSMASLQESLRAVSDRGN
jgi:hypothetical protein